MWLPLCNISQRSVRRPFIWRSQTAKSGNDSAQTQLETAELLQITSGFKSISFQRESVFARSRYLSISQILLEVQRGRPRRMAVFGTPAARCGLDSRPRRSAGNGLASAGNAGAGNIAPAALWSCDRRVGAENPSLRVDRTAAGHRAVITYRQGCIYEKTEGRNLRGIGGSAPLLLCEPVPMLPPKQQDQTWKAED